MTRGGVDIGADCGVLGSKPRRGKWLYRVFRQLCRNNCNLARDVEIFPSNLNGIIPCLKDLINRFLQNKEY